MARPPLPIGAYGAIATTKLGPARFVARTRYRDRDGVVRKVEAGAKSEAGATTALKAALAQRQTPGGGDITGTTRLGEVVTAWLAEVAVSERAQATQDLYAATARRVVLPTFGALLVREASVARLERLLGEVAAERGSGAAKLARTVLTGALAMAVRADALAVNPMREVSAVRQRRREVRALTPEQVRALRADLAGDAAAGAVDLPALVDVMLGTGARIGEALAIRWGDVDTGAATVVLSGTVVRAAPREGSPGRLFRQDTTKGHRPRAMVVPTFALAALAAQRERHPGSTLVFPSATGGLREVATVERQWRAFRARQPAWSAVTFHAFRRTVATVVERGAGLGAAAAQLGHSSERVTAAHYVERATISADQSALLGVFADVLAGFPPDDLA